MDLVKLEQLGLLPNEAKLYLVLLELGQAQAGPISRKAQINRTTTYDILERLIEKGLITYVIQANRKVFLPAAPGRFLERLKEQQKIADEILPELNTLYHSAKAREDVTIYRGKKGIKSILEDILKHKEYVTLGSRSKFLEIMKHDFIAYQKRKKERRIKSRVILSESHRNSELVRLTYGHIRFIPDKYTALTTTYVYGDHIAVVVWSEAPIATVITSKEVAESYKNYFELMWKQAKD